MSKQSDNRLKQNYEQNPILHICGNCKHYQDTVTTHGTVTSRRCAIGDFAVKMAATCKCWEA